MRIGAGYSGTGVPRARRRSGPREARVAGAEVRHDHVVATWPLDQSGKGGATDVGDDHDEDDRPGHVCQSIPLKRCLLTRRPSLTHRIRRTHSSRLSSGALGPSGALRRSSQNVLRLARPAPSIILSGPPDRRRRPLPRGPSIAARFGLPEVWCVTSRLCASTWEAAQRSTIPARWPPTPRSCDVVAKVLEGAIEVASRMEFWAWVSI